MIKALILGLLMLVLAAFNPMNNTHSPSHDNQPLRYLAIGDSYTIGEGVEEMDNYPNQLTQLLNDQGLSVDPPKIIAKTGWTTDELAQGIKAAAIEGNTYDFVTLLIGVNNQYRRRSVANYEDEFRDLLTQAITFAKGDEEKVIVVSIPDWGVTPFGLNSGRDLVENAQAIDTFNASKKSICEDLGVHYIDITEEYRVIGGQEEMLVSDQLHPSALVYQRWAQKISEILINRLKP